MRGTRQIRASGLVVAVGAATALAGGPYQGDIVIRAMLDTPEEVARILEISPDPWSHRVDIGPAEFRIPASARAALDASGIDYEIVIADLQSVIDLERESLALRDGAFYDSFQPLAAISAQMDAIVALRPDLAQRFTVGASIEGRNIDALTIGAPGAPGVDKPALLVIATQHAREWLAPMAAMFFAERLVTDYDTDPEVRRIVDAVDIHIVPVVNPDGYLYSWATVRLWRKNRRDNPNTTFEGVDLNRNWAVGWGGAGSSGVFSSEVYRGTAPFSEPETSAIRDFVLAHPEINALIDTHTYGQLILSPPGFNTSLAPHPDDKTFASLSDDLHDAIFEVHQVDYLAGPAGAAQTVAGGDSPDWHYFDRAMLSWTFELRPLDSSGGGFAPSPTVIRPTGEEFSNAALLAADMTLRSADIRIVTALPAEAAPDTPTALTARVLPLVGFSSLDAGSVTLYARSDSGEPWSAIAMSALPNDEFGADLPGAPAGATIEYYLEAAGTGGPLTTLPPVGADAPFTLPVDNPADISGDGVVDGADLGLLLGAWGAAGGPADLNGDGVVDGADLGLLLGAWSI